MNIKKKIALGFAAALVLVGAPAAANATTTEAPKVCYSWYNIPGTNHMVKTGVWCGTNIPVTQPAPAPAPTSAPSFKAAPFKATFK